MSNKIKVSWFVLPAALALASIPGYAIEKLATASVLQIMESIIVPASDTLWGVEDPQSEEEWDNLEEAAAAIVAAGNAISKGGTGPKDREWAVQSEWQALAETMVKAATEARSAIAGRDLDALFDAGDELYPPCEACHKLFNPAVQ